MIKLLQVWLLIIPLLQVLEFGKDVLTMICFLPSCFTFKYPKTQTRISHSLLELRGLCFGQTSPTLLDPVTPVTTLVLLEATQQALVPMTGLEPARITTGS